MQNTEYLKEYEHFNGEYFIRFNIVQNYEDFVTLAVTNQGKISLIDVDLYEDEKGVYFEYGCTYDKIYIEDFE